jgi:GH15 family glucan-1,4-alpha-glucosidase
VPANIEDYALLGDSQTAALVSRDGSIDWMCVPRFDSPACFAALVGEVDNGRWLLRPQGPSRRVTRRYVGPTLVLETTYDAEGGEVSIIDFMPIRDRPLPYPNVVRIVEGKRGRVKMHMQLVIRFDYGSVVPWVRRTDEGIDAVAGPDRLTLTARVPLAGRGFTTVSDFVVAAGDRVPLVLAWHPSHEHPLPPPDPEVSLAETRAWWEAWSATSTFEGENEEAVMRSLITLKALTYAPTGAIIAAPTTSLPEQLGGVRNWDYRYCWLRDATFTLYALMNAGYREEARDWQAWLLRAIAGRPSEAQIMYGLGGERRLPEMTLDWLPGYDGRPVRIGNGAYRQFQLDVYGEVMDALYQSRRVGLTPSDASWNMERALLQFVISAWERPDQGIWEVRGPRRHFTHSKVMAWVAVDRAIKDIEEFGLEGPVEKYRAIRERIHADVCRNGFDPDRRAFVQYYGAKELDASLLTMPLVGFLPPTDPRVRATIEAIERELVVDGFVVRYTTSPTVDGLPPGEGAFIPCTFWLADNLQMLGRVEEARELLQSLLALCNDVGLLSEQYDVTRRRFVGNFPQAFSHISLINTAVNLSPKMGPAQHRAQVSSWRGATSRRKGRS